MVTDGVGRSAWICVNCLIISNILSKCFCAAVFFLLCHIVVVQSEAIGIVKVVTQRSMATELHDSLYVSVRYMDAILRHDDFIFTPIVSIYVRNIPYIGETVE